MLTAEGCAARRRRLWESLPRPCDALLIADPQHLVYLANLVVSPFEFRGNDASAVLVLTPDRATLVGDNLLTPYLERSHVDEVVAPVWYEGKRSAGDRRLGVVQAARDALGRIGRGRLGIEVAALPAGCLDGLALSESVVELAPILREHRRVKDADELALIRRALEASDAGFAAGLAEIVPGMTEVDAFQVVQRAAVEAAGEPVRVYGDFVSGPRCEQGGGPPSARRIEPRDLVLLDFSVIVQGYRGDCANTFVAGRDEPTTGQRDLFTACLEAVAAGEALLRPGRAARDVDAAVRQAFAARGLAGSFTSHSGHGVGLGHPEAPFIVPSSDDTIMAGDVVTLEPGQYVAGVGGMRFERNYRITDTGFETLSRHELRMT